MLFFIFMKIADSFDIGYTKKKLVNDARRLFDCMCLRPVELCNRTVSEYVKLGDIKAARELFDNLIERYVITWNLMILGLLK